MEVLQSYYSSLPEDPGVYLFLGKNREILYVGKAKNLKKRVSSYFTKKELDSKTKQLVIKIEKIKVIIVSTELESLILEANLIKKYKPKYNLRLTDGKAFLRIKITIKDKNPKILLVRKEEKDNSIYFGPYPSTSDVKLVLKMLRKIFPFQNVKNHSKRYCLYFHLGLCPCPPMFGSLKQSLEYKKDIRSIVKFLEGKSNILIKDLERERDFEAGSENFEQAQIIQTKIYAINNITQNFRQAFEFEENPQLVESLRKKEISDLLKILRANNVKVENLKRIECFDISNISGIYATGSMVVFTKGIIDKKSYKRFRIKRPLRKVPNDYAMMQEVIERRFNHNEWTYPSLIIVDGGKGQVSVANKVLIKMNKSIPLIGIAKREEILITSELNLIRLNKNSPSIILVRRIRDEAHRFAITYHKKLRSKNLFES